MWMEHSYFEDTDATDCPGFCISTYKEVFILQPLLFLKKQLGIQICAHLSELLGSVFSFPIFVFPEFVWKRKTWGCVCFLFGFGAQGWVWDVLT